MASIILICFEILILIKTICPQAGQAFTFFLQLKKVNKESRRYHSISKNDDRFTQSRELAALKQRGLFP